MIHSRNEELSVERVHLFEGGVEVTLNLGVVLSNQLGGDGLIGLAMVRKDLSTLCIELVEFAFVGVNASGIYVDGEVHVFDGEVVGCPGRVVVDGTTPEVLIIG